MLAVKGGDKKGHLLTRRVAPAIRMWEAKSLGADVVSCIIADF